MELKLRPWQAEAITKARVWLLDKRADRHFLINAAPGAGKTLVSCALAKLLLEAGEIDRVIVIAPRTEIVNQWSNDFHWVTGRHMEKITARDGDITAMQLDVCATWAAVQGLLPELQQVCRAAKVLVICDEHRHAAVQAAWGTAADGAFADAKFALILFGMPISLTDCLAEPAAHLIIHLNSARRASHAAPQVIPTTDLLVSTFA